MLARVKHGDPGFLAQLSSGAALAEVLQEVVVLFPYQQHAAPRGGVCKCLGRLVWGGKGERGQAGHLGCCCCSVVLVSVLRIARPRVMSWGGLGPSSHQLCLVEEVPPLKPNAKGLLMLQL